MRDEIEKLKAERDMWREIAEEESWPFEWVIASKLKEEKERLKVEVDACHAALRTLLGAIPECDDCEGDWRWRECSCVRCDLEYEIGIAENILNNPIKFPELCDPILTKPRVLGEISND